MFLSFVAFRDRQSDRETDMGGERTGVVIMERLKVVALCFPYMLLP